MKNKYESEKNFLFAEYEVTTAIDFKNVWKKIYNITKGTQIKEIHIFSHSSKSDGDNDGLEFITPLKEDGSKIEDGTISYEEISNLEILSWSVSSKLVLHGCNSGIRGTKNRSVADVFAVRQKKCTVYGQDGYAYFSKEINTYSITSPEDTNIYLWAYHRGKNGMFGDGKRIPAKKYKAKGE